MTFPVAYILLVLRALDALIIRSVIGAASITERTWFVIRTVFLEPFYVPYRLHLESSSAISFTQSAQR